MKTPDESNTTEAPPMTVFTAAQIASRVGGQLRGDGTVEVHGVDAVDVAGPGMITFIRDGRHATKWAGSRAAAALCREDVNLEPGEGRALIDVPDADLALVRVLELFAPPQSTPPTGIHPTATVADSARIHPSVSVGPNCVIGEQVRIGAGCVLHAQVTLLAHTSLGDHVTLFPGVVIHERCDIGNRVILQANVVIGADGFGYRSTGTDGGLVKMPHIGTVRIEDDVEIGASSCVDRGKFSATVVGAGSKIDNLCQIAHNCIVGKSCVIAGLSGLAGSVVLGDGVMIGGKVAVRDGVHVGAGAKILACSAVAEDVPEGQTWGGLPAREASVALREYTAIRKLPDLVKRFRRM